jgi:vacuolar-type H+-ATPase subunit F/Vma7
MSEVLVITTDELAPGYALGGAAVHVATRAGDAGRALRELLDAGEHALIALHEQWYDGLERDLRGRVEGDPVPLVVPLPAGTRPEASIERGESLRRLLWQAVGYEITFDEGGDG